MQDTRNNASVCGQDNRGTVCIDTQRVLDSCRDRDCFEDVRVYLTTFGQEVMSSATNVRTKSAEILWAYVGVDAVPFNQGFYRVTVRYYVKIELEVCQGIGRGQTINGITTLEKDVILFGGDGSLTTYTSGPENSYCGIGNLNNVGNNSPTAVVEAIEPIVLGTKVKECHCPCECCELPENVRCCLDGEIINSSDGPAVYVSLGLFSIIRIQRPAQLLVQATDYCVPDKECVSATNNDNPCELFRTMAFPINRFNAGCQTATAINTVGNNGGGCGCGRK